MNIIEFDALRLGNDIRKIVDSKPRGFPNQIIKATGISHASFYRLMDGARPVQNVNMLLSVCEYLGLAFESYVIGRKSKQLEKRIGKQLEFEIIAPQFVERYTRKGYMTRDFFISGRRYQWWGNVHTPCGVVRVGFLIDG